MVSSQDKMRRFIFTQVPLDELSIIVYFVVCFPMSLLSTVWDEHFLPQREPGQLDRSFLVRPIFALLFEYGNLILHARKPPNLGPLVVRASCLRWNAK